MVLYLVHHELFFVMLLSKGFLRQFCDNLQCLMIHKSASQPTSGNNNLWGKVTDSEGDSIFETLSKMQGSK